MSIKDELLEIINVYYGLFKFLITLILLPLTFFIAGLLISYKMAKNVADTVLY